MCTYEEEIFGGFAQEEALHPVLENERPLGDVVHRRVAAAARTCTVTSLLISNYSLAVKHTVQHMSRALWLVVRVQYE